MTYHLNIGSFRSQLGRFKENDIKRYMRRRRFIDLYKFKKDIIRVISNPKKLKEGLNYKEKLWHLFLRWRISLHPS